ncbi:MAG: hypothetical protein KGI46_08305 [Alphaproteobacteria bacterium]|nr:hypothetical protein [Alphaproteobacteria bacterium]
MRCYFLRDGHIGAVELLTDVSDEAAIKEAEALFKERQDKYAGYEVWDRARFVHRFPANGNGKKNGNRRKSAA